MEIVKASAGSGKTFTLARKYIALLFSKNDRYAYRHILAVTFTNKATDEMKTRIMKELFILATEPEKSGYIKYFIPDYDNKGRPVGIDEKDVIKELPGKPGQKITLESLADSAKDMLCNILHDYSAFGVSTIDRFFQQTLKSFSREIGQFASYRVELDKDSLVSESVDRVLDAITEKDSALLKWLTDSVMEQIEHAGKYSLESSLVPMARRLKSDEHRSLVEKSGIDEDQAYSKENLSRIRSSCLRTIRKFEDDVKDAAGRVLSLLDEAGVGPEKFYRGFMSVLSGYHVPAPGKPVEAPTESFMSRASDPEQWFPKAKAGAFLNLVCPLICRPLEEFCSLFGFRFREYRTAMVLRDQLYALGVASDLYQEFNALMKEKNVLSIDDSNSILKDIIDGSDAPFVYEKTGVRYENFLLDEFQDTSRIQWDNFRPLIANSEAQGFGNLIVGDVKQSIYRWRGSDWNLLDSEVREGFIRTEEHTLDVNYRSFRNIVAFNNGFFPVAAAFLDRQYGEASDRSISAIYADVRQKMPPVPKGEGEVRITFCDARVEPDKVLDTVKMLRERGIDYGEMAVLVRNNDSGAVIAAYLIANNVPVITDDSLAVKSSVTIRRLCSLLSYADNPADTVNGYLASSFDIEMPSGSRSLVDLCESLLRELRDADRELFDREILYIQSFMDEVQDYVAAEGNSLHDFLVYWADAKPSVSSPDAGNSLRIMTIHKSKGLDFNYVIFPYVESVNLYKAGKHWCRPDLEGTSLDEASDGIYDVMLSSKSLQTFFEKDYRQELKMQYVDNINTVYVAFTRAVKGMYLIAECPSESFMRNMPDSVSNFSQLLYLFARNVSGAPETAAQYLEVPGFRDAEEDAMPPFPRFEESSEDDGTLVFSAGGITRDEACSRRKGTDSVMALESGYPSWPLNPRQSEDGTPVKARLVFSRDSSDFFAEDGSTGYGASDRLRGIVLHEILSRVERPSDLKTAVEASVLAGDMDDKESVSAFSMLENRIASALGRGWFPDGHSGALVRKEIDIIDDDGSIFRPDRVIEYPDGRVVIVDYKFGRRDAASDRRYLRQVEGYASVYRKMGYRDIQAAVWYVPDDEVLYSDAFGQSAWTGEIR